MTLRTRNRITISIFLLSSILLFIFCILFTITYSNGIIAPEVTNFAYKNGFSLLEYNPICVILSIFILVLFVATTTIIIYRSFVKTQAPEINFLLLFSISCIADSFRIMIPLLNLSNTYSELYIFCGNATLFSMLLAPISIFFTVIINDAEFKQNIEKFLLILIVLAAMIGNLIPLNTAVTLPNYAVSYSYKNAITIYSVIIYSAALIALFLINKSKLYSQKTTIGLLLIILGRMSLFSSYNALLLGISVILLFTGPFLYLKELHNQYLWND